MISNFVGKVFFFCLSFIVITIGSNLKWKVLPVGNLFVISYVSIILSITVWVTMRTFRKILSQNKPIVYDFENDLYLRPIVKIYRKIVEESEIDETKPADEKQNEKKKSKNVDERIEDFTKDAVALIEKWYSYVSGDETFLIETRSLIDDMIRRFLQIVNEIDSRKLLHGILVIFLNHIKEYQRTVRRQKKSSGSIKELYRYAHIASNNEKTFEHVISQLTNKFMRQFNSWEVYSSVPCKAVTSILAKKLTTYFLIQLSNPAFINYKLAWICSTQSKKNELNLHLFDSISLIDVDLSLSRGNFRNANRNRKETDRPTKIESNTPKVSPKKASSVVRETNDAKIQEPEVKKKEEEEETVVSEDKREEVDSAEKENQITTSPVKIHQSKSADKTWRNSSDLECISLGQDLLVLSDFNDTESEIRNLMEKKLWKENSDPSECDEKPLNVSPHISMEEPIDLAKDLIANLPSATLPSFISNTIKPIEKATASTLHDLQQTTVTNVMKPMSQATSSAMHRIGDLQDEAAGMMEGIFDFGMAGIRKGLRLTGLQEQTAAEREPRPTGAVTRTRPIPVAAELPTATEPAEVKGEIKVKRLAKVRPVSSEDSSKSSTDKSVEDSVWVNPLARDEENFDGHILLEKSVIPDISTDDFDGSPELEYEDTTDLATTTAKLRSLLQQKTTESNLTTPAVSPMPIDETGRSLLTMASSEYPSSSNEDLTAVDGALPSLYKFCARTATGVFQNTLNTLKTALPGNQGPDQEGNRGDAAIADEIDNWTFIASETTADDLSSKIEKLLNERKAFCIVDNAYEAIESIDVLDHVETGWNTPTRKFDDDLDDLEIHIPLTKTMFDIFIEASPIPFPETFVKSLLILTGSLTEEHLGNFGKKTTRSIASFVGNLPEAARNRPKALRLWEFTRIFLDQIPGSIKYALGDEVFATIIGTILVSLQCQKINEDISLQILELFASLLIDANNKLSPTYSA